jgi:hypothetical protein
VAWRLPVAVRKDSPRGGRGGVQLDCPESRRRGVVRSPEPGQSDGAKLVTERRGRLGLNVTLGCDECLGGTLGCEQGFDQNQSRALIVVLHGKR